MTDSQNDTDAGPTPGPWGAFEGKLKATQVYQVFVQPKWAEEEYSDIICEMPRTLRPNGEQEANARLIAAAGTAAHELPDGVDPLDAIRALPELIEAARSGSYSAVMDALASAEGSCDE